MKRIAMLLAVVAVVFTGCSKESRNEKLAEEYAGTYHGVFTVTRSEENVSVDSVAEVRFAPSAENAADLLMQSQFTLPHDNGNRYYDSGSEMLTSEQMDVLFAVCGIPHSHFDTEVTNASIEARFYSGTVAIKILFSDENGIVGNAHFTGSR